jgi:multicomponent Na+:H+ antiporter subunit E
MSLPELKDASITISASVELARTCSMTYCFFDGHLRPLILKSKPTMRLHLRSNPEWLKGFVMLWILLMTLWISISSVLRLDVIIVGVVIAGAIAYHFARATDIWQTINITPTSLYHFLKYTYIFLHELVRANVNLVRYVFAWQPTMRPGIVKVTTRLKSPVGRLALANSIALTPGSLVLAIEGDALLVHWLDVETIDADEATRIIAGPFEKDLERTFG